MKRQVRDGLFLCLLAFAIVLPVLAEPIRFVTVDPGHFHAALVQKWGYPDVTNEVRVFAPAGAELEAHLSLIADFNSRKDNPTDWREVVYRGADYRTAFSRYLRGLPNPRRAVVVLAGRNDLKADYILAAVEAGANVLADKPLAISPEGFVKLEKAVAVAREKRLALIDLMTDRADIHIRLADALMREKELFGELQRGTPENPSVISRSLHHFVKKVNGAPLRRPAWYYDVSRQGEGIVDVTTHIVDGLQRSVCPGETLSDADVRIVQSRTWDTEITAADFFESTGLGDWPDFLRKDVGSDNVLRCRANGEFAYWLKGVCVSVAVTWKVRDETGNGDDSYAAFNGTKCRLEIAADRNRGGETALFVRAQERTKPDALKDPLLRAMAKVDSLVPGLKAVSVSDGWRVDVPPEAVVEHDPSFYAFTRTFLDWVNRGDEPMFEYANLLVKYQTLTEAQKRAHAECDILKTDKWESQSKSQK